MEKVNVSLSPRASFYQNVIFLSYTVMTSETLGWFPGKVGHLPYNYTPLSFFKNISQNYVNHWSELGGRPDSEESLNPHYHISLNVNFLTSPHYQEGKMLAAIAWCCLNKILYPAVFIFCFSPSFPFTYLGAFHLNHCLLDSPLWIIICSDTTISENGAVNIYVNAEVVIFDSNVPGLDLKLSVHIDRAACQSPFCLTLLSD